MSMKRQIGLLNMMAAMSMASSDQTMLATGARRKKTGDPFPDMKPTAKNPVQQKHMYNVHGEQIEAHNRKEALKIYSRKQKQK